MMTVPTDQASQLLDNLHTAVLTFDGALRLRSINAAGEHLLSSSGRKLLGLQPQEILPEAEAFSAIVRRARDTHAPYTERGMDLRLGYGRTLFVDMMVTPLNSLEEELDLVVELVDVEAVVRARREENLSVLNEAARKSLRGVAHEIKNPLGGLRGAAQLLERELNGSDLTEYTRIIINEADRLRTLVDRMLVPNRKSQLSEVNIHEVLEYVQSVATHEAQGRIDRDYDPSLPSFQADRDSLIQALLNIVRNSIQAAGADGEVVMRTRARRNCTIRQQHHKLAIQIEITDNGPGVPVEIEQEMFYPMVTGRAEGMGLGLSIAQSLVQSHEGSIEYERNNGYTTFRILLPIACSHE